MSEAPSQAPMKDSARRVQQAIESAGFDFQVREFPASTRTSEEAAAAIGCDVAQIAKSLIFRAKDSNRPVLVMASGANRVDEKAVGRLLGEKLGRADADFVRAATGFAIGGVPPVGHREAPAVFIDADLMALDEIWAAAGTPNAVFRLTPPELVALTGGQVAALKKAG
ncbi:YbaK/EbsC family protein [Pelagibius marinus]|uniref:YbaK/EbsC family protein n=1 Tax=Pelagibius marinus TaxID=2762760 RepID=UPI001D038A4F|nr:YbaK/EbsC family protein [Pelagibius marinus]